MPILQEQIHSRIAAFTADLTVLVQKMALEAVNEALAGALATMTGGKAAPAKQNTPSKATTTKKTPSKPAAKAAPVAKKPVQAKTIPSKQLGGQRSPEQLVEKVGNYIKSNPGQGAVAIAQGLAITTSELKRPIKTLIAAKRVRFEGRTRATRYFPA